MIVVVLMQLQHVQVFVLIAMTIYVVIVFALMFALIEMQVQFPNDRNKNHVCKKMRFPGNYRNNDLRSLKVLLVSFAINQR